MIYASYPKGKAPRTPERQLERLRTQAAAAQDTIKRLGKACRKEAERADYWRGMAFRWQQEAGKLAAAMKYMQGGADANGFRRKEGCHDDKGRGKGAAGEPHPGP